MATDIISISATSFCCRFLGAANYVPATVIDSHTLRTVMGPITSKTPLTGAASSSGLLMLRPRQIQLLLAEPGNGRVIEQQFLGTHTRCVVECQNVRLAVSTNEALPAVSQVQVKVLPHALTFFWLRSHKKQSPNR